MRRALIGVLLAAMGGCKCDPVKNCRIDDDCGGGAECLAGICVAASAAAGGSGGSGGSATAGGRAGGGGGSGGGTAGGVPAVCMNVTCPTELGCIDDGGVANCVYALQNLRWSRPDAGDVYAPSGSIALIAEVDRVLPTTLQGMLSYQLYVRDGGLLDAGLLVGNGLGQYVGALPIGSFATRSYDLVTRTNGLSAGTWFRIDADGPVLGIQLQETGSRPPSWPDSAKWRRDEKPLVLVAANEPLSQVDLFVELLDAGVSRRANVGDCAVVRGIDAGACGASSCGCFEVSIPSLAFNDVVKDFPLSARARDAVGNAGSAAGPTLQATRVRWDVALPTGPNYPKAGAAVSSRGNVYQGTSTSLVSYDSEGVHRWTASTGSIEGSVAVAEPDAGQEFIFYAANRALGPIMQALYSDGGVVGTMPCTAGVASTVNASPALARGPLGIYATTTFNSDPANGRLSSFIIGQDCIQTSLALASNALDVDPGVNLVIKGDVLVVPAADGNLRAYRNNGGWNAANVEPGYPVLVGNQMVPFSGVALRGNGTRVAGAGAVGLLFEAPLTQGDGGVSWKRPGAFTASTGVPAVGAAGYLHGMNAMPTQLRRVDFTGAGETVIDAGTGAFVPTSPVVTQGGLVYWVTRSGTLVVTDESLTALRWSASLGISQVVGSPGFDCNRTGPGGVLYVSGTNGHLMSVLVDSPRLAATDWPKWQHDSQNSGNPDWPLNLGCP